MLICGVDPGLARLGYALLEHEGMRPEVRDFGCLETPAELPLPQRLLFLYRHLRQVLMVRPQAVAIESLFFNKNTRTAIQVAEARGAILLLCAEIDVPVFEYTPPQVKQAVVGYGRAEKRQVQIMLQRTLGLSGLPQPDDAADALAVAFCHGQVAQFQRQLQRRGDGIV
ncbi:MAG TPA: crossover junction endodeoxyribonuclease RuvC [bacterium]|jgi:crossover junction endodeoxyribonuclease RuvC|nr:crossover junction endodeoxyribonuclease RuvC [bacterium]